MNKFVCFLVLLLMLFAAKVPAQTFKDRMHFETAVGTGMKQHGITPVDFSFKFHVDVIPLFYLFVTAEDNLSLYKSKEVKTYHNGVSLGGGLGLKLLRSNENKHALDLRVKALGCAGNPDWKRNTYDASLAWYMKSEKFSPVVELGYRYLDSRKSSIDNYGNVYMSIGLRY